MYRYSDAVRPMLLLHGASGSCGDCFFTPLKVLVFILPCCRHCCHNRIACLAVPHNSGKRGKKKKKRKEKSFLLLPFPLPPPPLSLSQHCHKQEGNLYNCLMYYVCAPLFLEAAVCCCCCCCFGCKRTCKTHLFP
uniref:Uncharacterized protein n=1 Tax=Trypanosoma vivax (strain Y486) TaxID=1055687 RepID=G0TVN2_TRYVY|nr:hypothetical protein TVY486_0502040 [Trypanosoma vivax Y486]